GFPDLAVLTQEGVSVLLGIGNGTFQTTVVYAAGGYPSAFAAGDLNGDTFPELVVANGGLGVTVLVNAFDWNRGPGAAPPCGSPLHVGAPHRSRLGPAAGLLVASTLQTVDRLAALVGDTLSNPVLQVPLETEVGRLPVPEATLAVRPVLDDRLAREAVFESLTSSGADAPAWNPYRLRAGAPAPVPSPPFAPTL